MIMSIYAIGLIITFCLTAFPYVFKPADGLELLGLSIAALTAIFWPIVLVLILWDGGKWCLSKLRII